MKDSNSSSFNSVPKIIEKIHVSILLADDDKDDRLLFQDALSELDISSIFNSVYDGEQLIKYLNDAGNERPAVLFLDLNMPRKNGFACLEEIKRSENLKQIPVIIFSTSFDEIMADRLYKLGAHYYITKPTEFSDLKKVIEQALTLISNEKIKQPSRENFLISNLKNKGALK